MDEFDPWTHEVDFATYCPQCKYWDDIVNPNTCDECLKHPMNDTGSRKPVCYEENILKTRSVKDIPEFVNKRIVMIDKE